MESAATTKSGNRHGFGLGTQILLFGLTFTVTQLSLCLLVIGIAAVPSALDMGISADYFKGFHRFARDVFSKGLSQSLLPVFAYTWILVTLSLRTGIVTSLFKLLSFGLGLSVLVYYASKTVVERIHPEFFGFWQAQVVVFASSALSGLAGAWTLWRSVIWVQSRGARLLQG